MLGYPTGFSRMGVFSSEIYASVRMCADQDTNNIKK
jgi:hypothetical protein